MNAKIEQVLELMVENGVTIDKLNAYLDAKELLESYSDEVLNAGESIDDHLLDYVCQSSCQDFLEMRVEEIKNSLSEDFYVEVA